MADSRTVTIRQLAHYGDVDVELKFSDSWEVVPCFMKGHDWPRMSDDAIRAAFENPIFPAKVQFWARGKKEVVIIFDDMTRPTNVAELAPYVIDELEAAGIPDSSIRFMCGLGAHAPLSREEQVKKLGEAIVERFPIYNHCAFQNCTFAGKTTRGTSISINSEVMSCDFKIAIGGIVPHWSAGFGGGAKLVVPGVASIDTIWANHHDVGGRDKPTKEYPRGKLHATVGLGKVEGNVLRLDIEEAARMIGLDVIVNVVINGRREPIGCFVGDVVEAHRAGVALGKDSYASPYLNDADISVCNAYDKGSEALICVGFGADYIKKSGGTLVLMANTPHGQVTHFLSGPFGKNFGGKLWDKRQFADNIKKFIVVSSYIDRASAGYFGPPEEIIWARNWDEVLPMLKKDYPGYAKVAVIPDGTTQYCPDR
ncbi:MAG: lactate racemase domain-containing protein [Actinobacteria bacterium]|nr:lactate racemase domain-containing protein [Actinomycetota bacterium]